MTSVSKEENIKQTVRNWVELYSDDLFSWALYKVSSKETAEDLVQDTYLVAFQTYHKFEGKSNPRTWLFAILNNKINDHHRTIFRNTSFESILKNNHFFDENEAWNPTESPLEWPTQSEHILDDSEFNNTLESCMKKLPATWFSGIYLRYIEEKKGSDICQELEITPTNFWQILHRAKMQLRKCLEIQWFRK